jgi:hypothetical protein
VRRLCVPTLSMRGSKLMFSSSSWNPSRPLRALIAVGLAVIGAVLVWAALARPSTPEPALAPAPNDQSVPSTSTSARQPTAERTTAGAGQTDLRDQTTGLVLPESDPVAISIPRIGVQSRLVDLGLDADGAMEVPQDPARAGWFTGGPAPGALGPAVIAGHVTWNGAPEVFYRLGTMRRGDQVTVTRKDGKTAVFTVSRVGPIFEVAVPEPGGLRPHRPCRTATDHLWWHLRHSQTQLPGQCCCLRQAGGGAQAWWLIARHGQPLITSTKGLDVTAESGSNTRSR